MKKLVSISLLAILGLGAFIYAQQPIPAVSDTSTVKADSVRVDTVRMTAIHLNRTITNNIKGD